MSKKENILLNRFRDFIEEKKLISQGEKILLTVSGGIDSSVMTHLFSQSEFEFGIAHCNFRLRGTESDGDEKFVADLAKKYNKQFHSTSFDTETFSKENKYSIQEAARILRYNWFEKIAVEFNYQKIATAHQLDDSIETFFINLLRGTGTAGLRGISVKNKNIIRPLLFATRNEIEEYSVSNNIKYREDSSNVSDDYLRNKIRHHIIPVIKENSEGFEQNMERLMDDFSLVNHFLDERLTAWKDKNIFHENDGTKKILIESIKREKNPSSFLSLVLHSIGITGVDCKKLLASKMPGKIFHGKSYLILRDREYIILQNKLEDENAEFIISEIPAKIKAGNLEVSMTSDYKTNIVESNDKKLQVDEEKVTLPLTLRTWKPGDYFFPLGMKGKKKISDFYTDEKIDRFQKDKIYLLLSGKDIVCILGHRIDDRFKITSTTKKVLSIELSTS